MSGEFDLPLSLSPGPRQSGRYRVDRPPHPRGPEVPPLVPLPPRSLHSLSHNKKQQQRTCLFTSTSCQSAPSNQPTSSSERPALTTAAKVERARTGEREWSGWQWQLAVHGLKQAREKHQRGRRRGRRRRRRGRAYHEGSHKMTPSSARRKRNRERGERGARSEGREEAREGG